MRGIAFACVLAIAVPARADDKADAQRYYSEGQARYRAGEFSAAADSFRAAYDHDHDPVYLFNIAQAYRFAKACGSSAEYYRKFLAAAPTAPNRDKVNELLQEMDACAKTQTLDQPSSPPPEQKPIAVDEADGGAVKRYAGIALGAAGLVALGVGWHFQTGVHDVEARRNTYCAPPNQCEYGLLVMYDNSGYKLSRDARISYGVGAAAVVGGVVLYMIGRSDSGEHAVAVMPLRDGVAITGTF